METIIKELKKLQDKKYKEFQKNLIPNKEDNKIIGVRTPELRKIAKKMIKENQYKTFLEELPHDYFDENQLHGFILSEIKSYEECIKYVNKFLPYIDNWATCDQTSPKVFKKHHKELLPEIKNWINSNETYTIRFGIGMLMQNFLDEDFKEEYLEWITKIESKEYYVNMMKAWFFATALAKQYSCTIPYIENQKLDDWTHNKTIQKAIESYRITPEQKEHLKTLKKAIKKLDIKKRIVML